RRELEARLDRARDERGEQSHLPQEIRGRRLEADAPRHEPGDAKERGAVDQVRQEPREEAGGDGVHLDSGAFVSTWSIMSRILAMSPGLMSSPESKCCTRAVTSPSNSRSVSSPTIECCTSCSVTAAL